MKSMILEWCEFENDQKVVVESISTVEKNKNKKSSKVKELKTSNRKAGKIAKEKKEDQDFSKLVEKYSAKLG